MSLPVVCTDRGTHPQRRLGWLLPELGDDGRTFVFVPWGTDRRAARVEQRGTLRPPPCPTCRRTVPMRQETAARCYDTLTAAGLPSLDISRL